MTNGYQYGQVETAIAEVLGVKPRNFSALRARLRHMKNVGVPTLPKPGSGQKITYSEAMAIEMLLAAALEFGGFTPRKAAMASVTIGSELNDDTGTYVIVRSTEGGVAYEWMDEKLLGLASETANIFTAINAHALKSKLKEALMRDAV